MRKTKLGQELITGLKESIGHARGSKRLRTSSLEIPPPAPMWPKKRIAWLRQQRFHVSQPVFAAFLSVKPSTVRAWEQGQKNPSGAARRLLELAEFKPELFHQLPRQG